MEFKNLYWLSVPRGIQVTTENMEIVADMVHGAVKGIKHPVEDRAIYFWNKYIGEQIAEVDSWIIQIGNGDFRSFSNEEKLNLFGEKGE